MIIKLDSTLYKKEKISVDFEGIDQYSFSFFNRSFVLLATQYGFQAIEQIELLNIKREECIKKNTEELKKNVKKYLEDTRVEYENELGKKFLEISKQNYNLKEKIERLEKENEKLEWETIKLNKYNNILKKNPDCPLIIN